MTNLYEMNSTIYIILLVFTGVTACIQDLLTSTPCCLFSVQYQMEMMRNLRKVNIDHLHVGWYQSTYFGGFINRALLDSQYNYQHAIEESVVLIYGKIAILWLTLIKLCKHSLPHPKGSSTGKQVRFE